ncbi:MAG: DUF1343 domain-containing protein [Polyangiaceae bacterium]
MLVGLDRLPNNAALTRELASRRIGLLAHPASVDRRLRHVSEVFAELSVRPSIIFGPEHGYGGEAQDMIGVSDAVDPSGAEIVSLYGDAVEDLSPRAHHLEKLDLLVIDLADIGSRYYTFIWTALLATRAAVSRGVEVLVLDRPNPLGGAPAQLEGALQDRGFLSFVGLEPIAVRHALTLGEIVAHFAHAPHGALRILGVLDWERARLSDAWDRPFVLTSPNMPTADVALVYPGGCLIEGTNLSEGRGTTRPFELVGAPFLDGRKLARELANTGLPGFTARPLTFMPTFHKHAGKLCGGVQIHVTDAAAFRPYATYLALVWAAKRLAPADFRFRTERYEFIDHIPAFDLLTGSDHARLAIERGAPLSDWLDPIAIAGRDAAALHASAVDAGMRVAVTNAMGPSS